MPLFLLYSIHWRSLLSNFFRIVSKHSVSFARACLSIHEDSSIYTFNCGQYYGFDCILVDVIIPYFIIETLIEIEFSISCYEKIDLLWVLLNQSVVKNFVDLDLVLINFPKTDVFGILLMLILWSKSTIDLNILIWVIIELWRLISLLHQI